MRAMSGDIDQTSGEDIGEKVKWITCEEIGDSVISHISEAKDFTGYADHEIKQILPLVKRELVYIKKKVHLNEKGVANALDLVKLEGADHIYAETASNNNTSTCITLMSTTGLHFLFDSDAADKGIFMMVQHCITSWFKDRYLMSSLSDTRCLRGHIKSVILVQFFLSWFCAFALDSEINLPGFELFLPVTIDCELYGDVVNGCISTGMIDRVVNSVKRFYITGLKRWISKYTSHLSHDLLGQLDDVRELFTIFAKGLARFYPRAMAEVIFLYCLRLYGICTRGLGRRLQKCRNSALTPVFTVSGLSLEGLTVKLHLVPFSGHFVMDKREWSAFVILCGRFWGRTLTTDFGLLRRENSEYRLTTREMHSLHHPNLMTKTKMRILQIYLLACDQELECIKRLLAMVTSYIAGDCHKKSPEVPSLVTISLSNVLCLRDRLPTYFLSNYRKISRYVPDGVYRSIIDLTDQLMTDCKNDGDIARVLEISTNRIANGRF